MNNNSVLSDKSNEFFEKNVLDELIYSAQRGNEESFNKILNHYKRFISAILSTFVKKGVLKYVEYDDLRQEAHLGLFDAVKKFKGGRESKFISYAAIRIRGKVGDYLRNNSKLSRGIVSEINLLNEVEIYLEKKLTRKPTLGEVSEHIKNNNLKIDIENTYFFEISIDDVIDYSEISFLETTLLDKERETQIKKVHRIIKECPVLGDREKRIILGLYFGKENLNSLSEDMLVSMARISQIRTLSIKKLAKHFKVNYEDLVDYFHKK